MPARLSLSALGLGLAFAGAAPLLKAQSSAELQQVIERLDRLEAQNRELMSEIQALRQQLAARTPPDAASSPEPAATAQAPPAAPSATSPPAESAVPSTSAASSAPAAASLPEAAQEREDVQGRRIAQLDQEKISSDHRLPLTLTGMLLMNTFWTGHGAGGADNPTLAPLNSGPAAGGATFRQTVLGVKFDGPEIFGGGKITGSAYADFFGGSDAPLSQTVRLRVATIDAAWKDTTLTFALDKPIIAPREPDSLAQVGVSPLTSAGNLWLWRPQIRIEQRFALGDNAGLRAQAGVYETAEGGTGISPEYSSTLAGARPGYEGRFEFWAQQGDNRRIEIAPGFHVSSTRVLGESVPSRIFSLDWLIRPASRIDFTGAFFQGENTGVLGGLRQGVTILYEAAPIPVHAMGGWAQLKIRVTPRTTFNFYGGEEDDRNRDLGPGGISRNLAYAGNIMYRLGSNVLASFEGSQVRTTYLNSGTRIFPHYDLGLAYLF